MQPKLIFISPLAGFTSLFKKVCADLNISNYIVIDYNYYNNNCNSRKALEMLSNQENIVIVCKEFVANDLNIKDLPMVHVSVSPYDVFNNLYQLSRKYKKITYIGFWKEADSYDFNLYEQILGIKIHTYLFTSYQDIDQKINEALENGADAVLTTGECIARVFRELNIDVQVIYPGRSVIIEAIQRANEILKFRMKDIYHNRQLSTIINSVSDGILLMDREKKIILTNSTAQQILNKGSSNVLNKIKSNLGDADTHQIIKLNGAQYYISKNTISLDKSDCCFLITIKDAYEVQKVEQQIRCEIAKKGLKAKHTFDDLVGSSDAFKKVVEKAKKFSASDTTVLITGESGTGKELFAQSIHNASKRRNGPFVGINCAALPENLLETELFGHVRGAFTGATSEKQGLFELAHNGTIFLDEIGEIPLSVQAKLLRVIQEKEVRRIGGEKIIPIDVRIIAATNKDLRKEIEVGRFRTDLYYRLNVLRLNIPPLRERKEDIPALMACFFERYAQKLADELVIDPYLLDAMLKYDWPGNIRELENFCERYFLLGNDRHLLEEEMKEWFFIKDKHQETRSTDNNYMIIKRGTLAEMEHEIIKKLFAEYNGNRKKLAGILGISRTTLWKLLKEGSNIGSLA
ncbi:MAG: sigma 54-interacting transcriptional regulator [Armatimonadetes bacterium]|nr:sigma 54-interacting transcriptional regulator [Armatimonadota bacterium]